jgi:hypothetical protein
VFHVLNRANARMRIFDDEADYLPFGKSKGDAALLALEKSCVPPSLFPSHLVPGTFVFPDLLRLGGVGYI